MRMLLALLLLAPQEDVAKKIAPDAERLKKTAKKLAPAAREKVEKALGEKLEPADLAAPICEGYALLPQISGDKIQVRVLALTAKGPKGPIKVGVSVASLDGAIHAVRILENADDKAVEAEAFLSQFAGYEYTADLLNGPDVLQAAIKKSISDAELAAVIRMSTLMRAMGPLYERMRGKLEKRDATAAEDAAAIEKMYVETLQLLAKASFLKATQVDKFKGFAAAGQKSLGEIRSLSTSGKFDDAYRKAGELDGYSCSRCHGAYRRPFREARHERRVGNGYFSTQLDLAAPEKSAEAAYQAVGKAVRKAVLIASEAR